MFSKYNTHTKVKEYFRQVFQNESLKAENKYECAVKCSHEGANYAVYFKTVCQCIVNFDEELDIFSNYCLDVCSSLYDHYCQGDTGMLFFAIERNNTAQTEEKLHVSVQDLDGMTHSNCLVIAEGVLNIRQIEYCSKELKTIQYENIGFIYQMISGNSYVQWICYRVNDYKCRMYFRVLSRIINKDAIITFTNSITPTITTNIHANISLAGQTATFNQNYSISNATAITTYNVSVWWSDLYIRMSVGVSVFLGIMIVFLLVIVYIQRRKLGKASYTCLTLRRGQHIYNETSHYSSVTSHYLEILPLFEMSSSEFRPTDPHNIDHIQHLDTSGYLIPSSTIQASDD